MPIFKSYKINKCKEVMTISDTGSTPHMSESWGPYERLLNPNDPLPQNYGDRFYNDGIEIYDENFKGLFRIPILLGQLVEVTMNSGNLTAAQIDNMTSVDFDQMVANGGIRIDEKILGWVQISKARVSFFYEECFPNSISDAARSADLLHVQPVVEYYYDFRDFKFGDFFVQGSSPSDASPEYSIYPDDSLKFVSPLPNGFQQNQRLSLFGPGFSNSMDLSSYMRMFVNSSITLGRGVLVNFRGESRNIGGTWPLNGNVVSQFPLLSTTNIYLRSTNEILLEQPPGTPSWYATHTADPNQPVFYNNEIFAELRDIIPDGFKLGEYDGIDLSKTIGICIKTNTRKTTTDGPLITYMDRMVYVNDSVVTGDLRPSEIKSVDANFLYLVAGDKLDSNSPLNQKTKFLSKYSVSVDSLDRSGAFISGRKLSPKVIPDISYPDIPIPDDVFYVEPARGSGTFVPDLIEGPTNEDVIGNLIMVRITPFQTRRSKSFGTSIDLTQFMDDSNDTFMFYFDNKDTQIFDTKQRIVNSGLSKEEYIDKLIFIKEEQKKFREKFSK